MRTLKEKLQDAYNGVLRCYTFGSTFQIMIHLSFFVVMVGVFLGLGLDPLSSTEWIVLILCMSFTLAAEALNTSLEGACDLFSCGWLLDEVKTIKDVAAGAVLILSIGSAGIGLLIFLPKLLH